MSLCVKETKNNVAAYLDNLEVRILPAVNNGLGWAGFPRQEVRGAHRTSWQRHQLQEPKGGGHLVAGCRPEAGPCARAPQPPGRLSRA